MRSVGFWVVELLTGRILGVPGAGNGLAFGSRLSAKKSTN